MLKKKEFINLYEPEVESNSNQSMSHPIRLIKIERTSRIIFLMLTNHCEKCIYFPNRISAYLWVFYEPAKKEEIYNIKKKEVKTQAAFS